MISRKLNEAGNPGMAFKFIELDVRASVGWFLFNRPPVNAVHWEMLDEFVPALQELAARPDVKVVVIASALERYFSSGADIAAFKDTEPGRMQHWIEKTHDLARTIRALDKPVLAAIQGVAVGGGLEMTLHADLRFAAEDARLGQPEINIGFIPPIAGTQGLVRLVGRSEAFRMLYGGELMDAEAALRIGLVDSVSPSERLVDDVQAYGEMLASKPANALAAIRRCLIDGGGQTFDAGMEIEKQQAVDLASHPNFEEGIAAFLGKRKPNWV